MEANETNEATKTYTNQHTESYSCHSHDVCYHASQARIRCDTLFLPRPSALFATSPRNVSETFPLEVTMDWWSDSCWLIIDLWSKGWLLYAVVNIIVR